LEAARCELQAQHPTAPRAPRCGPPAGRLAPECFDNDGCLASDVFAFGLILSEAVVRAPVFPVGLKTLQLMKTVVPDRARAPIPDFVLPPVRRFIAACWDADPDRRPTIGRIVDRLEMMDFKMTEIVDSRKVEYFAKEVEDWETKFL
jgi:hypothetical protein